MAVISMCGPMEQIRIPALVTIRASETALQEIVSGESSILLLFGKRNLDTGYMSYL